MNNEPKDLAADVARQKLDRIFGPEPSAKIELSDATEAGPRRSKHQQFMYDLSQSGRSLAELQTAWHNYYANLPDQQKHEVWQEFYDLHGKTAHSRHHSPKPTVQVSGMPQKLISRFAGYAPQSVADIKKHILSLVAGRAKPNRKNQFKSLLFGLASGSLVVLILLFSFFNERFIAPFISPSKNVSSTQIIIDLNSAAAVSPEPKIIIPKINVEVPVIYNPDAIGETIIQQALEQGTVHYAVSPKPGEKGNAVIVGHSSSNVFNRGKYKFAFVLLNRLSTGDTFIINRDGKRYVYRVYDKRIVKPDDLSVLDDRGKTATVTLITCDPPGTSVNRLIVVGEQITPDPDSNIASTATHNSEQPSILPSNAPSLWQRIKNWFTS